MKKGNDNNLKSQIKLVSVDKVHRSLFILALASILGSVIIVIIVLFKTEEVKRDYQKAVVIIDPAGNTLIGSVSEMDPHEVERLKAINVTRVGVMYMYSFSKHNYDERINFAQLYFGKSGSEILQKYLNEQVGSKVKDNDLIVSVAFPSNGIDVSYVDGELKGKISFDQSFLNGDVISKRKISATCTYTKVKVSKYNGYGLVVENWVITEELRYE
ncbi:MAG: hypothetical protein ACJASM_000895 [Salibacteraceae bacterium]|jgi:hypothetical protein